MNDWRLLVQMNLQNCKNPAIKEKNVYIYLRFWSKLKTQKTIKKHYSILINTIYIKDKSF